MRRMTIAGVIRRPSEQDRLTTPDNHHSHDLINLKLICSSSNPSVVDVVGGEVKQRPFFAGPTLAMVQWKLHRDSLSAGQFQEPSMPLP